MVKPMLIPAIPPVTGIACLNAVVANLFDYSSAFHQCKNSFKRPRRDDVGDDPRDRQYDLTRDFPPLSQPGPLKLNTAKILGLLVKVTKAALPMRARIDDESASAETRELAITTIALMEVLDAIVEAAIILMAGSIGGTGVPASAASGTLSAPCRGPFVEPGLPKLKAALTAVDKTTVVFDANLGSSQVPIRTP
jgi:hypothetical protein